MDAKVAIILKRGRQISGKNYRLYISDLSFRSKKVSE